MQYEYIVTHDFYVELIVAREEQNGFPDIQDLLRRVSR